MAATSRNIVIALRYTSPSQDMAALGRAMVSFKSPRQELHPLDLEILERAFDAALAVVKENHLVEFDSDEGLETILRRELIEIAHLNGVSDPETLRDIVLMLPLRPGQ